MRKVINNKLYDTDNATKIAEYSYNSGDFSQFSEELYKTKNGVYFMVGDGGPMSKYHETIGNTTYGTRELSLMNVAEVKRWLANHDKLDELEKEFGLPEEG